jgi:hypothetical protein
MRYALAFSALAIICGSPSAFAGVSTNLTGVWEGSFSCKTETAEGKGSFKERESTLLINQLGALGPLVVEIDPGSVPYSGTLVPSAGDPNEGAGAWIACGTSDATTDGLFNEIETFHYKVDPADGSGTIKKSGAYVTNGVEVGVCKGSWKRVTTKSPKIVACAAL